MGKRRFVLSVWRARVAGSSVAIGLALAGCAVGPDFQTPSLPPAASDDSGSYSYTATPLPAHTAAVAGAVAEVAGGVGVAQNFAVAQDIPAQWWAVFHSEALDQLIRSALAHSPNLAAAQATLRQSRENFNASAGSLLYPNVGAQLGVTRERASDAALGLPGSSLFTLYNTSVNVSYTLDVFGASRRTLEGLQAGIDYQHFQVEAAYLTLTSNLVTAAIREASLRAQLQATQDVLAAQKKQLQVIERQFELGAIARTAVLTQRNQVAQTVASVPGLEKSLAQTRHQLSALSGRLPSEAGLPEFQLATLTLPQELPISLPSALVRQRPDIRASEALLHAASAQIGVATANQYPQINLTGSYGFASTAASSLFDAGLWSLGAGLLQPIFDGGALSAKRRAAVAAYDQADAQYRATVLGAFQNVADSLRALEADAATLKAQAEAESLARESLTLVTRQYQLGGISYLVLLDAQRTYQQARVALVQAQAARYADTAALFQALGGGWWNQPALADAAQRP